MRDLARLGLGRIAHEQGRIDDARYYYYLVPRDSDRLAEALYEAATTRYEKKDYDGARELLDELAGLGIHHRYEDEAWMLDAYVDLARCRFADADKKLVTFLERYEPVRDAARRIAENDVAMQRAARRGALGSGRRRRRDRRRRARRSCARSRRSCASTRRTAACSGVARCSSARRRGSSTRRAPSTTCSGRLATNGGVRPTADPGTDDARKARDARDAIDGVEHQIDDLESARAPADQIAPLRQQLVGARRRGSRRARAAGSTPGTAAHGRRAQICPISSARDAARAA